MAKLAIASWLIIACCSSSTIALSYLPPLTIAEQGSSISFNFTSERLPDFHYIDQNGTTVYIIPRGTASPPDAAFKINTLAGNTTFNVIIDHVDFRHAGNYILNNWLNGRANTTFSRLVIRGNSSSTLSAQTCSRLLTLWPKISKPGEVTQNVSCPYGVRFTVVNDRAVGVDVCNTNLTNTTLLQCTTILSVTSNCTDGCSKTINSTVSVKVDVGSSSSSSSILVFTSSVTPLPTSHFNQTTENSTISTGAIIGIAVGVIIGIIVLIVFIVIVVKGCRQSESSGRIEQPTAAGTREDQKAQEKLLRKKPPSA